MTGANYSSGNHIFSAPEMGEALVPHVDRIYRFALSLTRDPDQAQDLTQSTYLRAVEKCHLFDGVGRLDSWCMAICRSIWLNERRAAGKRQLAAIEDVPEEALTSGIPHAEENIFAAQVLSEVMALPEAQRATVMLVYGEGYRYSEAAEILDVPIGTVMSRLAAARGKLGWLKASDAGAAGRARGK
ncbi:MAG: RNA polymerase sigma factor [Marinibacterium sp.]|nr:RNA polymerase sigma factor [Marinibacterium sp.]